MTVAQWLLIRLTALRWGKAAAGSFELLHNFATIELSALWSIGHEVSDEVVDLVGGGIVGEVAGGEEVDLGGGDGAGCRSNRLSSPAPMMAEGVSG